MRAWNHLLVVVSILLPAFLLIAQTADPPVPSDPLELVTGNAQPVQDVSQRAEIVNLLINAHQHSNVRAQPYDLRTTFRASGSSSPDGMWQMEDISPSGGLYRWTARGPSYSSVHLTVNRVLYTDQAANYLPLRLAQVREAIFFTSPKVGPLASLRMAKGNLDGVELTCALISYRTGVPAVTGGRHWDEDEYCVNPKAGALVTYSLVPGLYVHYDYSKALAFHDKLIANAFTITQAGQTVIEAETESVSDPAKNPAAFQPAGLNQIGVGPVMTGPWRLHAGMPAPAGAGPGTKIVLLEAMRSPNGQLTEVEVLASTDASIKAPALDYASKWQGQLTGNETEPGGTPQWHPVLITVQYRSDAPPQ